MKRRHLVIAGVAVVVLGAAAAIWAHEQSQPIRKRGSSKQEFVAREPKSKPRSVLLPWPTYGYDLARTHLSPFHHRPPYRRVWHLDASDTLEFPPSIGDGRVYLAQQRGLFFAADARTGRVEWRKSTRRCSASSPTVGRHAVYQSWMDFTPCPEGRPGAKGYLIAWEARTGHRLWKFNAAPIESSPLLVGHTLYVGSWDHRVYAVDARTGRKRWSFETDDRVNTSGAYWRGKVYFGTDGGSLYALSARTGKLRWEAHSKAKFGSREFFYASPTIAYGRIYIGNTDGTMYVFGARTGKLRWARPLGSYVYSAAAIWRRRVYVGTYDGSVYALSAATGDVIWHRSAPGAVHSAPTVMDGLVYFSTCQACGSAAQRSVKHGPKVTLALDARTGRRVWSFPSSEYANPVVADSRRVYLTGQKTLFAMAPQRGHHHRRGQHHRHGRHRHKH